MMMMTLVVVEDVMDSSSFHYKNIQAIQKVIEQEILGNSYSLDQLLDINDKMMILINSLGFWLAHEDMDRYTYDLQSFLAWVKEKK
jgi:N6-adenosine-specific RNA methylase IME4